MMPANENFSPRLQAAIDRVRAIRFHQSRADHGVYDEDELREAAVRIVIATFEKYPHNNG